jgi:putative hydrolase of the HAD superfamily
LFELIAFDADDTLWQNESLYVATQDKLKELLSPYADGNTVEARLFETEMRNLEYYGYGIKSFTLSLIETALELSNHRLDGAAILRILAFAKEMLTANVQLLDGVEEPVRTLARSHRLMIITKGDLRDQQSKLARSSLGGYFRYVEIVSEKSVDTYERLLEKYQIEPRRFLMVGNSLKSDVLPVLALGAYAVYVPHHMTWAHEVVDEPPTGQGGFHELEELAQLPALVAELESN